jgi:hypothetical protein
MLGLTALTPLGWGLIGTASLAAVAISRGFSSGNFPLSFSPDLAHDPKEKTARKSDPVHGIGEDTPHSTGRFGVP